MDVSKTGVYVIENLVNGKKYVGSAARSFKQRFQQHSLNLRKGRHKNKHLQAAWNKYGAENFKFDILAICPPCFCLHAEQFYLDAWKPEYNKAPTAGNNFGVKLSDEAKQKISLRAKERFKDPSQLEALSKRSKEWFANPSNLEAHKKRQKEILSSESVRNKMSEGQNRYYSDPKNREANRQRQIKAASKLEVLEANRQRAIKQFSDPLAREILSQKMTAYYSDPQKREEQRQRQIIVQSNPAIKERIRDANSKFEYEILTPLGKIDKTTSLRNYCQKHGLSKSTLSDTFRGFNSKGKTVAQHKGYKVLSKTLRKK